MIHSLRLSRLRPRRGFTLLEVLIAMGVSSMLIVAVYFFFTGMMRTGKKSENRLELNQIAEIALERMVRELQLAVEMVDVKPDKISFRRPRISRFQSKDGYEVNMDLTTRRFETVTFKRRKLGPKRFVLERKMGLRPPEALLTVNELDEAIFTGWVMPKGSAETPHEVPDLVPYDRMRGVSSDLKRIPLLKIRLKMGLGRDRIDIVTKAFVPPIYARIIQPNYNQS